MTEDTPATSTDPATGTEGDSDQLPLEDTLVERGVQDILDEGYSPPDRPRHRSVGETAWEAERGETLDERVAQEEPEVWQSTEIAGEREPDRAGRLVAEDEGLDSGVDGTSALDVGPAGGAASAEEAAVRVVDEDAVGQDYAVEQEDLADRGLADRGLAGQDDDADDDADDDGSRLADDTAP